MRTDARQNILLQLLPSHNNVGSPAASKLRSPRPFSVGQPRGATTYMEIDPRRPSTSATLTMCISAKPGAPRTASWPNEQRCRQWSAAAFVTPPGGGRWPAGAAGRWLCPPASLRAGSAATSFAAPGIGAEIARPGMIYEEAPWAAVMASGIAGPRTLK